MFTMLPRPLPPRWCGSSQQRVGGVLVAPLLQPQLTLLPRCCRPGHDAALARTRRSASAAQSERNKQLPDIQPQHRPQFPDDTQLAAELQHVRSVAGTPAGLWPRKRDFVLAGKRSLYVALSKHEGGISAAAARAGLVFRKGPGGVRYRGSLLASLTQVREELESLAAAGVCASGTVPSRKQLLEAGMLPLYGRLSCIAGGCAALAIRLGMRYEGRTVRRQSGAPPPPLTRAQLEKELRAFLRAEGGRDDGKTARMPSKRRLLAKGRADLVADISRNGGAVVVAMRMGLLVETRGRPSRD